MHLKTKRTGRNSPCPCGSGEKYKKCCLSRDYFNQGTGFTYGDEAVDGWVPQEAVGKYPAQEIQERRSTPYQMSHPHRTSCYPRNPELADWNMSEVILDYAGEFLEMATTEEEVESGIGLSILAWNLSLKDGFEDLMDDVIENMQIEKGSRDWAEMRGLLIDLVLKKQRLYPFINRLVPAFEIIFLKDGFIDLKIFSSDDIFDAGSRHGANFRQGIDLHQGDDRRPDEVSEGPAGFLNQKGSMAEILERMVQESRELGKIMRLSSKNISETEEEVTLMMLKTYGFIEDMMMDGIHPHVIMGGFFVKWLAVVAFFNNYPEGSLMGKIDPSNELMMNLILKLYEIDDSMPDEAPEPLNLLGEKAILLKKTYRDVYGDIAELPLSQQDNLEQGTKFCEAFSEFLQEACDRRLSLKLFESLFLYFLVRVLTLVLDVPEEFFQRLERNWPKVFDELSTYVYSLCNQPDDER